MVIFVLCIIGIIHYSVVEIIYGPKLFHSKNVIVFVGSLIVVISFSALTFMTAWSYLACVNTDPGSVPLNWHPFADEHQAKQELERMTFSTYYDKRDPRRPRYCRRCHAWKPERSHHCSVSARCVLKMDHYCIWVINCVGLLNYKFFLLFIGYSLVGSIFGCALILPPLIRIFENPQQMNPSASVLTIGALLSGVMALALVFFLGMHGQLVTKNLSTIEMYEKERIYPWPYDRGARRNFEEVFGKSKWQWFLPRYSKSERLELLSSCLDASSSRLMLMEGGMHGGGLVGVIGGEMYGGGDVMGGGGGAGGVISGAGGGGRNRKGDVMGPNGASTLGPSLPSSSSTSSSSAAAKGSISRLPYGNQPPYGSRSSYGTLTAPPNAAYVVIPASSTPGGASTASGAVVSYSNSNSQNISNSSDSYFGKDVHVTTNSALNGGVVKGDRLDHNKTMEELSCDDLDGQDDSANFRDGMGRSNTAGAGGGGGLQLVETGKEGGGGKGAYSKGALGSKVDRSV